MFEWFSNCLNNFQIATEPRKSKALFSDIQPWRTKKVSFSRDITWYCRSCFVLTFASDRGKEIADVVWASILQVCVKERKDLKATYWRSVGSTAVIRAICCPVFICRMYKVDGKPLEQRKPLCFFTICKVV